MWWYVDLVDDEGNGAVCIWSWALPFLPGVASSARAGRGVVPRTRPSFNLSVYRQGRPEFYVLQELPAEACRWEHHRWTFGRTTLERTDRDGRLRLEATIDLDLSGPRLPVRGYLTLEGPLRTGLEGPRDEAHSWEPLTLGSATGQLTLEAGSYRAAIQGRAYHDRNGGRAPLQAIGISDWRWGRFALPGGDLVFTTVRGEGEDFVVWVDADGRATRLAVTSAREASRVASWIGPCWPRELRLETERGPVVIHQASLVDDAPFYQRAMGTASFGGHTGPGIAERVLVRRLDPAWMRPLVRMRVDRGPQSSFWLPLFNGPRVHRHLPALPRRDRA